MSKYSNINDIPTGELAELLHVDGSFISNCKAGRNKLSFEHCLKIHKKYKIPLYNLRSDIYPKNIFGY